MLEGALTGFVGFLALLGAVALVLRLSRSILRVVVIAAELASVTSMAESSARRGDLTGLSEGREAQARARAARRWGISAAVLWLLWLTVPIALGWTAEAYAIAAPLWFLPGTASPKPVRPAREPDARGT